MKKIIRHHQRNIKNAFNTGWLHTRHNSKWINRLDVSFTKLDRKAKYYCSKLGYDSAWLYPSITPVLMCMIYITSYNKKSRVVWKKYDNIRFAVRAIHYETNVREYRKDMFKYVSDLMVEVE